jgi:hypothetical protein
MTANVKPANMALVTLPISGLVAASDNALVAWHPKVSLRDPLLVVLFLHGREPDPQNFAWANHNLPRQIAIAAKNAVLIAPTMRMVAGSVDPTYLSTVDGITKLVRAGLAAIGTAVNQSADGAFDRCNLFLVGYSNGYIAWGRAVTTLRATPAAAPMIGHSLFDCLFWDTPLMRGAKGVPPTDARLPQEAKGIAESAYITTHFTKGGGGTLTQAASLTAMVPHEAALKLHTAIPASLAAGDVVITHLSIDDHFQAVSFKDELANVISVVPGFDLPLAAVA